MDSVVYQDMAPDEEQLDWTVTRRVFGDAVLMRTLKAAEDAGEKHAVVALVEHGELRETFVSSREAVERQYPFNPVRHAFEAYEPGDGVCLLIVRDGKAVISINTPTGTGGRN
jgi:hypothetical protein